MDQEILMQLAIKAGAIKPSGILAGHVLFAFPDDAFVKFVGLIAEECAQIAEQAPDCLQDSTFDGVAREIRRKFCGDK